MPADGVAIVGCQGGSNPVWARVYVSAASVSRVLDAPKAELSTEELGALYAHKAIKGGAYRQDELRRLKVTSATLDSLTERGLLKTNVKGARTITTAGKNALGDFRPSYGY